MPPFHLEYRVKYDTVTEAADSDCQIILWMFTILLLGVRGKEIIYLEAKQTPDLKLCVRYYILGM